MAEDKEAAEQRAAEARARFNAEAKARIQAKAEEKERAAAAAKAEAACRLAGAEAAARGRVRYGFTNPVHVRRKLAERRAAGYGSLVELRLGPTAGGRQTFDEQCTARLVNKLGAEGYRVEVRRDLHAQARLVAVQCLGEVVGRSSYEAVHSNAEIARLVAAAIGRHNAAYTKAKAARPEVTAASAAASASAAAVAAVRAMQTRWEVAAASTIGGERPTTDSPTTPQSRAHGLASSPTALEWRGVRGGGLRGEPTVVGGGGAWRARGSEQVVLEEDPPPLSFTTRGGGSVLAERLGAMARQMQALTEPDRCDVICSCGLCDFSID